jgi:hypothetical protein
MIPLTNTSTQAPKRSKFWTRLLYLHLAAFFVHSLAAGLTAYFSKGEATIPVSTFFRDSSSSSFTPAIQHVQDFPSGYLTVGYSLPSALEHLASFLLLHYDHQTKWSTHLLSGPDYIRWASYSISAPIMMVQMCLRSGAFDPVLLSAVAFLYFTMMTFGLLTEALLFEPISTYYPKLTLYLGWIPFTGAWAVLFTFFFKSASTGKAPWWVYVIVIGEFFIMNLFGVVMVYAVSKHSILRKDETSSFSLKRQYVVTRIITMYLVLSLTAKVFLAVLNWYGSQQT